MTDQLERLFADLRMETLAEVRAPGTNAARRTVRRRRTLTSAGAALAVVAVVAGLAVGLHARGDDLDIRTAARQPASGDMWLAWAATAAGAIGLDLDKPGLGGVLKEDYSGPLTAITAAIGGTYNATVACVGDGSVTVVFEGAAGGHPSETRSVTAACAPPGQLVEVATTQLTVPGSEGKVLTHFVSDSEAFGRSSVAFRLELTSEDQTRIQSDAIAALATKDHRNPESGGGNLFDGRTVRSRSVMEPGRYLLRIVCLGAGSVTISIELVTDTGTATPAKQATMKCGPKGSPLSFRFTALASKVDAVDVIMTPDEYAVGQAAAAFRVDRD